jgi:serine/threonine protein kinase
LSLLAPGTILADRYQIVDYLGTGSMGVVYLVKHRQLADRLVALKVLYSEFLNDEVALKRFKNEIAASYDISHQNVVRIYEFIQEKDLLAYSMEFADAGDLADFMEGLKESTDVKTQLEMLIQVCSGINAIHRNNIIHRDLKPENILVLQNGLVKIADFGIAQAVSAPRMTEHGNVLGTLTYISPEYLMKGQVDARSDIYAFGVISYEFLTGTLPYPTDNITDLLDARNRENIALPTSIASHLPSQIDDVLLKALSYNPDDRYQDAAELLSDLTFVLEYLNENHQHEKSVDPQASIILRGNPLKGRRGAGAIFERGKRKGDTQAFTESDLQISFDEEVDAESARPVRKFLEYEEIDLTLGSEPAPPVPEFDESKTFVIGERKLEIEDGKSEEKGGSALERIMSQREETPPVGEKVTLHEQATEQDATKMKRPSPDGLMRRRNSSSTTADGIPIKRQVSREAISQSTKKTIQEREAQSINPLKSPESKRERGLSQTQRAVDQRMKQQGQEGVRNHGSSAGKRRSSPTTEQPVQRPPRRSSGNKDQHQLPQGKKRSEVKPPKEGSEKLDAEKRASDSQTKSGKGDLFSWLTGFRSKKQ